MGIVLTERTFEVRFYIADEPGPFDDYHAICTIVRLDSVRAMIVGLNGKLTRQDMRDLISMLYKYGYLYLLAQRAPGRRMPFGIQLPDSGPLPNWWQLDLAEAISRAGRIRSKSLPAHHHNDHAGADQHSEAST